MHRKHLMMLQHTHIHRYTTHCITYNPSTFTHHFICFLIFKHKYERMPKKMKRKAYLFFVCHFHCFFLAFFPNFLFRSTLLHSTASSSIEYIRKYLFFMWKTKKIQPLTIIGFCVNNLLYLFFKFNFYGSFFVKYLYCFLFFPFIDCVSKFNMQKTYDFRSF